MTPVLFAYGGWQTSSFVAGEMKDPSRDLPRALLIGVVAVIVLYMSVTFVCLRALGAEQLATTKTPASAVMRAALGERGATFIALGIAISTLGFLSQGMLTAPRVYFAMAQDGLFFRSVAWLDPRTAAPVVAIALQGVVAVIIALSGRYEQILNYVISVDFISFGMTGVCAIDPASTREPIIYWLPRTRPSFHDALLRRRKLRRGAEHHRKISDQQRHRTGNSPHRRAQSIFCGERIEHSVHALGQAPVPGQVQSGD